MNAALLLPLLGRDPDPVQAGARLRDWSENSETRADELLEALDQCGAVVPRSDPAILGALLRLIHVLALRDWTETSGRLDVAVIERVLRSLPEATVNRSLMLHLLAKLAGDSSLRRLVSLLEEMPPRDWIEAAQVISPLMQSSSWPIEAVFPRALGAVGDPTLAAPILDLANFLVRTGRVETHPADDHLSMLHRLLGEISQRLARFEEDPRSFGDDVETVQRRLSEAVAVAVSVCDSLGLIGDEESIGKLNQALELRHRRVQCEAAGALARLGNEPGRERLIELAADPAARLRAIAYADELGFGDRIDDQFKTAEATAEADMSLWLSQPQQMGVPPTHVEVIESRHLHWPSFHQPIDVRLVRFEYNFGERCYSNVGITGPVTFAISADVADLPNDDIFAVYAGWHAEHPDIFSIPADRFNEPQRRIVAALAGHLDRMGYASIRPELLGFFLDEHAGVFAARREETECLVVTDGLETIDQAVSGRQRPLQPADLFNLYKGRKMLRTFNG